MKRINVKLLVILIAVTVGFGVATILLHEFQSNRRADGLLVRVDQLHESKRFADAIRLQRMYCFRRPNDYAAQSKLALLMKEAIENYDSKTDLPLDPKTVQELFLMLEKAIRRNEGDRTLLEAAVDVDIQLRRFSDAIVHLENLIEMDKGDDDSKFRVKLALCYMASGREADALSLLKQLVGYDDDSRSFRPDQAVAPQEIEAYSQLALLYERKQEKDSSDAVLEQMTEANPDNANAWAFRAFFSKSMRDDGTKATNYIDRSLELAPEDESILAQAGNLAIQDQQFERGKALFERLLAVNPNSVQAYLGLATWSAARRDFANAINYLNTGLEKNPGEFQLLWRKGNIEVEMGRLDQAEKTLAEMRDTGQRPFYNEFFEGRMHIARQEWLEASNKLAGVRHLIAQFQPDWVNALDSSLAACYEQLGKHDLRLEVLDRVLAAEPNNVAMRLSKAQALSALRQTSRAIEEYEELQRLIPNASILSPTMLGAFFDLELMKQLSKDEKDRNWQQAENLVQLIAKSPSVPRSVAGKVMERFFRASGQSERADKLFEQMLAQNPNSLQLQVDKVYRQSLTKDGFEPAMAQLEQLRKKYGDLVEFRLLEANMLVANRDPNLLTRLAELEQKAEDYEEPQKIELYFQLGRYFVSEKDFDNARRLWMKVAELRPDDIEHAMRLFELDIVSNRISEAEQSVDRIAKIVTREGSEYKWAKAALITLEVQAESRPKSDLKLALALVNESISSRGNWEAPYRLRGEIHTLSRQFDAAIESFERAVEVGSTNAETFKRLARLYYDKRQFRKCKNMYEKLPTNQWDPIDQQINVEVMAQLNELPEDVAYNRDSKEPGYHLQIGTILSNAKRFDEAQVAFQRAVELASNNADAWGALFENYLRQGKKEEADAVLKKAQTTIPPENLPRFLGASYQLMGDWEQSEKFYLQALESAPDDQRLLQSLAQLYSVSGRTEDAVKTLERMVKLEQPHLSAPRETVAWARRTLAAVIMQSGTYEDFQRAIALVEDNAPEGAILGPQDMFQWAQICARRPDPAVHRLAIRKLQKAEDERGLVDEEKLALAELYKRQGNWSACKSVMMDLLATHADDTRYVTPWLSWLIEEKDFSQAETFVSKIPSDSMVSVRTMAHIYASRGKTTEAVKAVAQLLPKNATAKELPQVMAIGAILEELGSYDETAYKYAEKIWQRVALLEPNRVIQLAGYYNRRKDKESALKGMAAAKKYFDLGSQQKTGAMQIIVQIYRNHYQQIGKDSAVEKSVRALFDQVATEQPENGTMLVLRSEFEEMMGKSDDAEKYLRQFLDKPQPNPRDRAVVLNNLAYRLAIRGEGVESEQLVSEAEKLLGPRHDLRDTKGMVYLAQRKYQNAIDEFQESINSGGPGAIKYLHLALAFWQNGDKKQAVEAVKDAQKMNVDDEQMTGFERQQYIDLLREMKRDGIEL